MMIFGCRQEIRRTRKLTMEFNVSTMNNGPTAAISRVLARRIAKENRAAI